MLLLNRFRSIGINALSGELPKELGDLTQLISLYVIKNLLFYLLLIFSNDGYREYILRVMILAPQLL